MSNNQEAFRPSPQQERLWSSQPEGPAGCTQAIVSLEGAVAEEVLRATRA